MISARNHVNTLELRFVFFFSPFQRLKMCSSRKGPWLSVYLPRDASIPQEIVSSSTRHLLWK